MEDKIKRRRFYLPSVKKLRLIIMAFAILYSYGLHIALGDISGIVLGFSFPALYVVSGYVVLRESPNTEKRILRTIKRTAICFAILFVVYVSLSFVLEPEYTLTVFKSKRVWFDLIVFNIWPLRIGSTVWFVQALLYAYIVIYIIYKLKLLRFDIFIAGICLAAAVLLGELSSVIGFKFLWYTYIGGNFFTRALPYILIGCFIDRKKTFFKKFDFSHYTMLAIIGILLALAEYVALRLTGNLSYPGHLLGMGVTAVAVCLLCFYVSAMRIHTEALANLSRFELAIPYFVCSPVYYLLGKFFSLDNAILNKIGDYVGLITLIVSFLILWLYILIRLAVFNIVNKIKK